MKVALYIIGIFISLFASVKILQIIFSVKALTEYGKGYVLGDVVLLIIGLTIVFFARKKKKRGS